VRDLRLRHDQQLATLASDQERHERLCELNVLEQVCNVSQTTIVRDAWQRGQELAVHGWIYDIRDGLLRDLDVCVTGDGELAGVTVQMMGVVGGPVSS
jgi:carbonic anhydrase